MRIEKVEFHTTSLLEMKWFYARDFGLPVVEEEDYSFIVKAGYTQLQFTEGDKKKNPFYHFAFNIPKNKLPHAKRWILNITETLKKDGEDEFSFQKWNAKAIYFHDPQGNIVEFIERYNLPDNSEDFFDTNSILSVSEIGLPVLDVPAVLTGLQQEAGLPVWREYDPGFVALGDEEGLLLLVPVGHEWFPTGKHAEMHPVRISLKSDKEFSLLITDTVYHIQGRRLHL